MEGQTQTVTLNANPEVCSIMIRWLYSQKLEDDGGDRVIAPWKLIDLWILGDYLMMPLLQDEVMTMYMKNHRVDDHCSWILHWVFKATLDEYNPLRRMLVEEVS